MDRELLISNIEQFTKKRGIKPTAACIEAGVGKTFLSDIRRGKTPSVAKVADLAAFLGVSTSELIGDTRKSLQPSELTDAWEQLNDEGQRKLVEYADDLVAGGRYIKTTTDMGEAVG